jgi:hypothetical protein
MTTAYRRPESHSADDAPEPDDPRVTLDRDLGVFAPKASWEGRPRCPVSPAPGKI